MDESNPLPEIEITMKDPDGVWDAIENYLLKRRELVGHPEVDLEDEIRKKLRTWFEWDEYVTIIINLETGATSLKKRY